MHFDQPTIDLLDRVRAAGRKPFSACTAAEARAFPTLMKSLFGEGPKGLIDRNGQADSVADELHWPPPMRQRFDVAKSG